MCLASPTNSTQSRDGTRRLWACGSLGGAQQGAATAPEGLVQTSHWFHLEGGWLELCSGAMRRSLTQSGRCPANTTHGVRDRFTPACAIGAESLSQGNGVHHWSVALALALAWPAPRATRGGGGGGCVRARGVMSGGRSTSSCCARGKTSFLRLLVLFISMPHQVCLHEVPLLGAALEVVFGADAQHVQRAVLRRPPRPAHKDGCAAHKDSVGGGLSADLSEACHCQRHARQVASSSVKILGT